MKAGAAAAARALRSDLTSIRQARPGEGRQLSRLEADAASLFREIGRDAIADAPPSSPQSYERWIAAGGVLVADIEGALAAFLAHEPCDGHTFICEVSVHPALMGKGIGRALMDALPAPVSLSCFTDVPWNKPYYARLGFEAIDPATLGPGHSRIARDEAKRFHPWPRCVMFRAESQQG
ncbi:MAG: GNAT family N-acetyltransferase [Sphingomonadales bacterium]